VSGLYVVIKKAKARYKLDFNQKLRSTTINSKLITLVV